jgi:hypothetical protein
MPNPSKTLVIVEGFRREVDLVECMAKACGMTMDIYAVGGNIYAIYQALRREGFDANVKDIAAELTQNRRDKEILKNEFVDTFLIFDCDAQHTDGRHEKDMPPEVLVARNMTRIAEMAPYFDNSTEPTKGKLFVNYPMIESYRDCDDFFDPAYERASVSIAQIGNYKQMVGRRKLCSHHLDKFTSSEFERLCRMNVFKLSSILGTGFQGMDYSRFLECASCTSVAEAETKAMQQTGLMPVLNTSLFLPLDYFGNKEGYYDRVVNGILTENGQ